MSMTKAKKKRRREEAEAKKRKRETALYHARYDQNFTNALGFAKPSSSPVTTSGGKRNAVFYRRADDLGMSRGE